LHRENIHFRQSWEKSKKKKHPSARAKVRLTTPRGWTIDYAINSSVINRLTSRSLSGQSLRIQVHHHFGFRLHLIWQCARMRNKKQKLLIRHEKCIERKFLTLEAPRRWIWPLLNLTLYYSESVYCSKAARFDFSLLSVYNTGESNFSASGTSGTIDWRRYLQAPDAVILTAAVAGVPCIDSRP
jgi:hypothetical protein